MQKITPHLWFDSQAEAAATFYVDIFKDSKLLAVSRYGDEGKEIHGQEPGTAMTVEFELNGQRFLALNGGPLFSFSPAVSFMIDCEDQAEVDYYWDKLTDGGDVSAQQCGWLKDKFGLSWQVVPKQLPELLGDADRTKADRAMKAMLQMKKLDINELRRAHDGA